MSRKSVPNTGHSSQGGAGDDNNDNVRFEGDSSSLTPPPTQSKASESTEHRHQRVHRKGSTTPGQAPVNLGKGKSNKNTANNSTLGNNINKTSSSSSSSPCASNSGKGGGGGNVINPPPQKLITPVAPKLITPVAPNSSEPTLPVKTNNSSGKYIRTESTLGSAYASTDNFTETKLGSNSSSSSSSQSPSAGMVPSQQQGGGASDINDSRNTAVVGAEKSRVSLVSVIEWGVSSEQGIRKTMEDRHSIRKGEGGKEGEVKGQHNISSNSVSSDTTVSEKEEDKDLPKFDDIPDDKITKNVPFFAIYDGHGGCQCAAFLKKMLYKLVLSQENLLEDPQLALKCAILKAEEDYLKFFVNDSSGSTAACLLIIDDCIYTANVGDTEIVLSRDGKPVLLSEKHNIKGNDSETNRVIEAGGRVHQGRVGHPLYNPSLLSLAVSRAIGDAGFKLEPFTGGKTSGVIATPFTLKTEIDMEKDEFIVIGCDGLWDVLTYMEVVDFCRKKLKEMKKNDQVKDDKKASEEIAKALVKLALDKGTTDNVTVLIISLEMLRKMRPGSA